MTLNFSWIRCVGFCIFGASFSFPCWSQEQQSPTAVASPTSEKIGLIDQVATLRREVDELKQRLSTVYQYGVAAYQETIYIRNGDPTTEFQATNSYPTGNKYTLDARIPRGAEVVQAWVVPYEHLIDISAFDHFSADKDPSDPSKILLWVTPKGDQTTGRLVLRVYVLYRQQAQVVAN
jgi:hypothetical protein